MTAGATFEPPVRRFERVAAGAPLAIAAELEGQTITYRELDRRANRLASRLRERGVGGGAAVAVSAAPSLELLAAMLAIWKAGGAYLPLDPAQPAARAEAILDDARPLVVLAPGGGAPLAGVARLAIDEQGADEAPPGVELRPDQAATIFYTSGTTGLPKGVVGSQGNLEFYASAARERYGFSASDVFCSVARYAFSISLLELLSPLLCGGRLLLLGRPSVLDPSRLAPALRRATVVHAGPSLLGHLFGYLDERPASERVFPGVRHASTGGDMVPARTLERMLEAFPAAEVFVIYGCTEVGCMATTFAAPRGQALPRARAGLPFPGVAISIEQGGAPVAAGAVGEVVIASPAAADYLGQAGRERFGSRGGLRSYATGDLGRVDASGNLELLGRIDDQIQLHGVRIEPAEIEQALRQLAGVREAAAVACEHPAGKALVAFAAGDGLDASSLRRGLIERLPDSMVPTDFFLVDRLPLNENLKVDRKALSALAAARLSARRQGPTGDLEEQIAALFARYLGAERAGPDDDFFDLGGSSILALRVVDELCRLSGLSLPAHALFQHPTARALAAVLRHREAPGPRPILLSQSAAAPPLFMLAAVHSYRPLARELEGDFSVYGLSIDPPVARFSDHEPLGALAQRYAELLRAGPSPLRLAGYSFGGVLAYEVAQRLRRMGRAVEHLWLLDAILPLQRGDLLRRAARFLRLSFAQQRGLLAGELRGRPRAPDPAPLDRVAALDELRARHLLDSVKEHLPHLSRYEGPATLVVAGRRLAENPMRDPACGWGRHIHRLAVHTVDAHHKDLLSPPSLAAVASAFRAARR